MPGGKELLKKKKKKAMSKEDGKVPVTTIRCLDGYAQ